MATRYFSPATCMHHYRRVALQEYKAYAESEKRRLKRFFYALRCALAWKWIQEGLGVVPMPFMQLVAAVVTSPVLRQDIAALVEQKRAGRELDSAPRIGGIEGILEGIMSEITATPPVDFPIAGTIDDLNVYFRAALGALWQNPRRDEQDA